VRRSRVLVCTRIQSLMPFARFVVALTRDAPSLIRRDPQMRRGTRWQMRRLVLPTPSSFSRGLASCG
jgi:hypothetical protein